MPEPPPLRRFTLSGSVPRPPARLSARSPAKTLPGKPRALSTPTIRAPVPGKADSGRTYDSRARETVLWRNRPSGSAPYPAPDKRAWRPDPLFSGSAPHESTTWNGSFRQPIISAGQSSPSSSVFRRHSRPPIPPLFSTSGA